MKAKTTQRSLLIGIVTVAVVLVLALLVPLSRYARVALLAPDAGRIFRPIVRHQISQRHCYDDGSRVCERQSPQRYKKEFTVGFVAAAERPSSRALYSCFDALNQRFTVTLDKAECVALQFPGIRLLGYVFTTSGVEAPTPLYRCINAESQDTLLTDGPRECTLLGGYGTPELLGYLFGAGHLPQRRLNELCAALESACALGQGTPTTCTAKESFCRGPS